MERVPYVFIDSMVFIRSILGSDCTITFSGCGRGSIANCEGVEASQLEVLWVVQGEGDVAVVGGVGVDGKTKLIILINTCNSARFLHLLNAVAARSVKAYINEPVSI